MRSIRQALPVGVWLRIRRPLAGLAMGMIAFASPVRAEDSKFDAAFAASGFEKLVTITKDQPGYPRFAIGLFQSAAQSYRAGRTAEGERLAAQAIVYASCKLDRGRSAAQPAPTAPRFPFAASDDRRIRLLKTAANLDPEGLKRHVRAVIEARRENFLRQIVLPSAKQVFELKYGYDPATGRYGPPYHNEAGKREIARLKAQYLARPVDELMKIPRVAERLRHINNQDASLSALAKIDLAFKELAAGAGNSLGVAYGVLANRSDSAIEGHAIDWLNTRRSVLPAQEISYKTFEKSLFSRLVGVGYWPAGSREDTLSFDEIRRTAIREPRSLFLELGNLQTHSEAIFHPEKFIDRQRKYLEHFATPIDEQPLRRAAGGTNGRRADLLRQQAGAIQGIVRGIVRDGNSATGVRRMGLYSKGVADLKTEFTSLPGREVIQESYKAVALGVAGAASMVITLGATAGPTLGAAAVRLGAFGVQASATAAAIGIDYQSAHGTPAERLSRPEFMSEAATLLLSLGVNGIAAFKGTSPAAFARSMARARFGANVSGASVERAKAYMEAIETTIDVLGGGNPLQGVKSLKVLNQIFATTQSLVKAIEDCRPENRNNCSASIAKVGKGLMKDSVKAINTRQAQGCARTVAEVERGRGRQVASVIPEDAVCLMPGVGTLSELGEQNMNDAQAIVDEL